MADDITRSMARLDFGFNGFDVVTANNFVNTSTNENGYYAVKAINANAQVDLSSSIGDGVTDLSLTQGDVIFGMFTNVAVDSGTVVAYRR